VQFLNIFLYILLAITSLFLICLVLIQRGKGGGLAGAFGGVGGSSAFGTKAGDVFTRVTMIAAGFWIALNMLLVIMSNNRASAWATEPGAAKKTPFTPGAGDVPKAIGAPSEGLDALPKGGASKDFVIPPADRSGGAPSNPLLTPPSPGPTSPVTPLQGPKP